MILNKRMIELTKKIELVQSSHYASFWLKNSLKSALQRDCLDSWTDAKFLCDLLEERLDIENDDNKEFKDLRNEKQIHSQ